MWRDFILSDTAEGSLLTAGKEKGSKLTRSHCAYVTAALLGLGVLSFPQDTTEPLLCCLKPHNPHFAHIPPVHSLSFHSCPIGPWHLRSQHTSLGHLSQSQQHKQNKSWLTGQTAEAQSPSDSMVAFSPAAWASSSLAPLLSRG